VEGLHTITLFCLILAAFPHPTPLTYGCGGWSGRDSGGHV